MNRFIPKEKLNKKARKELDSRDRLTWGGLNPATRKTETKKAYNRKKTRIRNEDFLSGVFYGMYDLYFQTL